MTAGSVREYREAIRGRYLRAGRKEKTKILDEFTQVTGYHQKAAIRLIRIELGGGHRERRGGRRRYDAEVVQALHQIWEASDRLCSKRLKPFLGELARVLRGQGELQISNSVGDALVRMSPATIDRLLRPSPEASRLRRLPSLGRKAPLQHHEAW